MRSDPKRKRAIAILTVVSTALALVVASFGAFVRLNHAGLGCPDWPGCYGAMIAPSSPPEVAVANASFPERPVEPTKGHLEMIHRYLAGALGLLVFALAFVTVRDRSSRERGGSMLALFLVALVIGQALLGMLTVTWQLKPIVVTAHLLGGSSLCAGLWLATLDAMQLPRVPPAASLGGVRRLALLAVVVVLVQIALGGWTSTNYAALVCPTLPLCGETAVGWADLREGFVIWHGLGVSYEFGVLDHLARAAIHLAHRAGALVTAFVVGLLAFSVFRGVRNRVARRLAVVIVALVTIQVLLGIANVVLALPLVIAVLHHAGALALLLSVATLAYHLTPPFERARRTEHQDLVAGESQ